MKRAQQNKMTSLHPTCNAVPETDAGFRQLSSSWGGKLAQGALQQLECFSIKAGVFTAQRCHTMHLANRAMVM